MDLEFTPAGEEDIPALYAFNRELIDRYEDPAAIHREQVLSWVERKLRARIGEYTRICLNGQTAGYYRFHPEGDEMELDDLYLFPAFRRRGIGRVVVEKCLAETEKTVFLYVFTGNDGALALYESAGFVPRETVGDTRVILARRGTKKEE